MPPTQRKRTRKRKRRAAFSSSSSSSSSDTSSSENEENVTIPPATAVLAAASSSESDSESSSSSSSSSAYGIRSPMKQPQTVKDHTKDSQKPTERRHLSPSPPPPPADLPSFLPSKGVVDNADNATMLKEQELKTKFRQFWMASVADGFKDDLEEIRKEPNLGTSRLALLIDSLASGADVFSSSSSNSHSGVNEMDVLLS